MASAAPRPCRYPACGAVVTDATGYCDVHRSKVRREADARRNREVRSLYTYRWAQVAKAFLVKHPLCECEECKTQGRVTAAEVVDHIKPHRGDRELFWNRANWQAMSKRCHDRKTAKEDGGWGRA